MSNAFTPAKDDMKCDARWKMKQEVACGWNQLLKGNKLDGKRIGPRTTCGSVAEAKGEASYVCGMVRKMDCVRPCGSVTGGVDVDGSL